MPAAFDQQYVKRLHGTNVKRGKNKRDLAEQLREDIREFRRSSGVDRVVMIWAASTEVFLTPGPAHQTLQAFEKAMERVYRRYPEDREAAAFYALALQATGNGSKATAYFQLAAKAKLLPEETALFKKAQRG